MNPTRNKLLTPLPWQASNRIGKKRLFAYQHRHVQNSMYPLVSRNINRTPFANLYQCRIRKLSETRVPDASSYTNLVRSFSLARHRSRPKKTSIPADSKLEKQLKTFSAKHSTAVSLKQLLEFGSNPTEMTLLRASVFLHHELPIRLANKAVELENLPCGLSSMPSIMEVRKWYITSFKEIVAFRRPSSLGDDRKFTNLVKEIYERHSGVLWTMAKGVYELKKKYLASQHSLGDNASTTFALEKVFPEVQTFLDNFFVSRVGIRVLIGQHIGAYVPCFFPLQLLFVHSIT